MDRDFHAERPLPLLPTKRVANSRAHARRAAFENRAHRGGGLRMLVEFREGRVGGAEEGAGVEGGGVEAVVVDADSAVGVTEGEIGGEIEEEGAGGGEGEFGEGGGIDAGADATRAEYEPEIENKEAGEEKEAAEFAAASRAAVGAGWVRHTARVPEMGVFLQLY